MHVAAGVPRVSVRHFPGCRRRYSTPAEVEARRHVYEENEKLVAELNEQYRERYVCLLAV